MSNELQSVAWLRENIIEEIPGAAALIGFAIQSRIDALLAAALTAVADAKVREVRLELDRLAAIVFPQEQGAFTRGYQKFADSAKRIDCLQPSKPALHPKAVEAADEVRRWPTASRETVAAIITRICFGGGE
jgi:hypothetical protein